VLYADKTNSNVSGVLEELLLTLVSAHGIRVKVICELAI
jgi:hypothetical protein